MLRDSDIRREKGDVGSGEERRNGNKDGGGGWEGKGRGQGGRSRGGLGGGEGYSQAILRERDKMNA
jgi:hypothetical protein